MENKENSQPARLSNFKQLNVVTTLSKYLALALFIALPFLGGWVGYNYSPKKVVELQDVHSIGEFLEFENIESITWSMSFGMCAGYCYKELVIQKGNITEHKNGRNEKEILNNYNYSGNEWESLLSNLDIKSFVKLSGRIGCPDCTDGGAESLKINFGNGVYKIVVYDFGTNPEGLEAFLKKIRNLETTLAI